MGIVAVGATSFLARATKALPQCADWLFLSHRQALADASWARRASVVINFAFAPSFSTAGYSEAEDIDSRLAALIREADAHYIMLSSRTVYGESHDDFAFSETRAPNPASPYGRAKLAVERSLVSLLGEDRVTILRLSNIFGHEYERRSFFGMAMTSLRDDNKITLDISPEVMRDFLAVWRCAPMLATIARTPQAGIHNLGAGFGTPCGKIATWLMEGYGTGEMIIADRAMRGQFWLDMAKTRDAFGFEAITAAILRDDCLRCGAGLRDVQVNRFGRFAAAQLR